MRDLVAQLLDNSLTRRGFKRTMAAAGFPAAAIAGIGGGADSTWYQAFGLAEKRTRNV